MVSNYEYYLDAHFIKYQATHVASRSCLSSFRFQFHPMKYFRNKARFLIYGIFESAEVTRRWKEEDVAISDLIIGFGAAHPDAQAELQYPKKLARKWLY